MRAAKYMAIGGLGLSMILPQKVKAGGLATSFEVIENTFSQPNTHELVGRNKLDWYGSGDVNNDEVINQTDVNSIVGSNSDRADVDGDGSPGTNADKSLLQNYVSGNINHLPGDWNSLTSKGERVNWLEKMLAVQDMSPYIQNVDWVCGDYINQMLIDFNGIANPGEFNESRRNIGEPELDLTNNSRFNIPFYHSTTISTQNGGPHSVGAVLVGENPLDFNDWYPINYYTDTKVLPGDADIDENEHFIVGTMAYLEDSDFSGTFYFTFVPNLINFDLNNGNATLTDYWPTMILDNPNDDIVELSNLTDKKINYQPSLDLSPNKTGKPTVTVSNSPLEAILTNEDGSITPLNTTYPNHHYSFVRTFTGTLSSGGVTHQDNLSHTITVEDTEDPTFTVPTDKTITQEEVLSPDVTGRPTNVKDNSGLSVDVNYNYVETSQDQNQIKYDVLWNASDVFGNDTEKTQKVTVLKAGVKMNSLENLLVNYGQKLTTEDLEDAGFEAIPKVELYNTTAIPVFSYKDSATVPLNSNYPDIHYKIPRTHYATIEINGQEMKDSTKHYVEVKDMETPSFVLPPNVTITKDKDLDPINTGLPTEVRDNSPYDVVLNVSYELVTEDETEKEYFAIWTASDVLENEMSDTQKVVVDLATSLAILDNTPNEFSLSQNYPNPFNPSTTIVYEIPNQVGNDNNVRLSVFDVLGNEVSVLVDERKSAGSYSVEFNGSRFSSGVYFYKLVTGSFVETKKMILVR